MLRLRKILGHLNVIFGGMFLTFFWLDRAYPAMSFLDNTISKWLLCVFSLAALTSAAVNLTEIHRRELEDARASGRNDKPAPYKRPSPPR